MCDEPASANAFQAYLHRAVMDGLAPDASYRYRLAGEAEGASTPFRAAPRAGDARRLMFVAFGDLGDSVHAAAKSPG
jgi:hypothetical protein